ncbi:zinc ribbon domain-containing protein [Hyalangium rubrum]|uniref:Zinc ribbon domain-containing protein n=1 Tax=Hyalangium rubrum TaxID=3103134 RepID=A0ABU5H4Y3_9BACT|nr:zinc ribbon domain-containing protein [Hyalangium sp. s54d21]MDY7228371.1 zinc ribbon domain-containing protein [Hyalangium sp. s54d21]
MLAVESQCERCHSALEAEDLRCPVCALPTPRDSRALAERERARLIRCNTCGAAIAYSVEAQAPRCAYCASEMHLETQEDPIDQAEHFVPFAVNPEQARQALSAFLGNSGFFRPSDLASRAALDSLKPLWWPGWEFSARVEVSWTADTDAGAHRSAWAPHAGMAQLVLHHILVSASRGLTEKETDRLAPSYDIAQATSAPQGPEGAQVELFDLTRSGARKQILAAVEKTARERISQTELPGRRHRNLHVSPVLSGLNTTNYALPAYVLAYRYGSKLYRVVVHGQDASCVLGEKPVSWTKVILTSLAVLAVILVVAMLFLRS